MIMNKIDKLKNNIGAYIGGMGLALGTPFPLFFFFWGGGGDDIHANAACI